VDTGSREENASKQKDHQRRNWSRNSRSESCGLSTSEISQPSGPLTTMKFRVIAGHGCRS
jgi:hypothetical protein